MVPMVIIEINGLIFNFFRLVSIKENINIIKQMGCIFLMMKEPPAW